MYEKLQNDKNQKGVLKPIENLRIAFSVFTNALVCLVLLCGVGTDGTGAKNLQVTINT